MTNFNEYLRLGDLSERTITNYLAQIKTMKGKWGLSEDGLNVSEVILKMQNDIAPNTMNLRKKILKKYLQFKGVSLEGEVERVLKRNRSRPKRKIHMSDLIKVDEIEEIIRHTRKLRPLVDHYHHSCLPLVNVHTTIY